MEPVTELKDIEWYKLDVTNQKRYLTPYEHNFVVRRSLMNMYYLMETIPDMKRLENAYRKILEAYPSLLSEVEYMPNGTYRYSPRPVTCPDFAELLDKAPVIASNEEMIEFAMSVVRGMKIGENLGIRAHLLRIDVEASRKCPVLQGKFRLVLYIHLGHILGDGTSMSRVPILLNTLYNDPSYVIPVVEPQRAPVVAALLMPDECIGDEKYKVDFGPGPAYNGYLNSSMDHPPAATEKQTIMISRTLPSGTLGKIPVRSRLTCTMVGLHAFMVMSLLFHQHPQEEVIRAAFGQPRLIDFRNYKQPFKQPFQDLFGNRVYSIVTIMEGNRAGFGLYDYIARVNESIDKNATKETEYGFMKGLVSLKRLQVSDLNGISYGRHRVSNIGKIDIPSGVITCCYGFGNAGDEFGTIHLCPTGEADGSLVFIVDADSACFTREFLDYYLDVYLLLWDRATRGDINYTDFILMPEYRKLCQLLDVKRPDWL